MEKKIAFTALAAVFLSLSGNSLQAKSPCALPEGTWKHTCKDAVVSHDRAQDKCTLSAKCNDKNGHPKEASYEWTPETLSNCDGELKKGADCHK